MRLAKSLPQQLPFAPIVLAVNFNLWGMRCLHFVKIVLQANIKPEMAKHPVQIVLRANIKRIVVKQDVLNVLQDGIKLKRANRRVLHALTALAHKQKRLNVPQPRIELVELGVNQVKNKQKKQHLRMDLIVNVDFVIQVNIKTMQIMRLPFVNLVLLVQLQTNWQIKVQNRVQRVSQVNIPMFRHLLVNFVGTVRILTLY